MRLSTADMERLRAATGRSIVEPRDSLFGPRSVTWRVNREAALLLGGGRALLLQVAHPLVAAAVARHSDFRSRPLQRLRRTLELTTTIVFADAAGAIGAVRQIEAVHSRVRGTLPATVGPFRRGTAYDANDPELLFWVHATLADTAVRVYERFVRPLTLADKTALYEESKVVARLFGVPDSIIPPALAAFNRYMDGMIRGPVLAVGRDSREIAASILRPPLPPGARQIVGANRFFTVGLLPPVLRRRYGLRWSPRRERALDAIAAMTRAGLPLLPRLARSFPRARRAAGEDVRT
jgi:uncharacterized protein (DUF2236 family)